MHEVQHAVAQHMGRREHAMQVHVFQGLRNNATMKQRRVGLVTEVHGPATTERSLRVKTLWNREWYFQMMSESWWYIETQ